jgi:hypothetical protein
VATEMSQLSRFSKFSSFSKEIMAATSRLLMIRPERFGYNAETAQDNEFQNCPTENVDLAKLNGLAQKEFDGLVSTLESNGIEVNVENDSSQSPDAVFPNNWISFHDSFPNKATPFVIIYPMKSPLRRTERQMDIVEKWSRALQAEVLDLTHFEMSDKYLEGTGSMVIDRTYNIIYACLSSRTHLDVLEYFSNLTGYKLITFNASQRIDGRIVPIYHTNVMMSVGEKFAIVCLECITDQQEKNLVVESLKNSNKTIIDITEDQMNSFVGNVLEISNKEQMKFLALSTKAYKSLEPWQEDIITQSCKIIHSPVDTIEYYEGGGVRCMLAEIFPH